MTNLERYEILLAQHDWFYEHSDDPSVWRVGRAERSEILSLQSEVDPDLKIWSKYCPK